MAAERLRAVGPGTSRLGAEVSPSAHAGQVRDSRPRRRTVPLTPLTAASQRRVFLYVYVRTFVNTIAAHLVGTWGRADYSAFCGFGNEDQTKQLCNTFFFRCSIFTPLLFALRSSVSLCVPLSVSEAIPHIPPIVSPLRKTGCSAVGTLLD